MVWVRSEHAGALAVLSVWANVFIPWSISHSQFSPRVSRVVVRFHFVAFQFLYGIQLEGAERPVLWVFAAPGFPQDAGVVTAYQLWLLAAAIFAIAVLISLAYYAAEERLENGPVDPVRVLGALLVGAAIVLSASVVLLWNHVVGITVPLGVLFLYALGGTLLVIQRT